MPRHIADRCAAALPVVDGLVFFWNQTAGRFCSSIPRRVILDALLVLDALQELFQLLHRHPMEVFSVDVTFLVIVADVIPRFAVRAGRCAEDKAERVVVQLSDTARVHAGLLAEVDRGRRSHIAVAGVVRRVVGLGGCDKRRCGRGVQVVQVRLDFRLRHEAEHVIAHIAPLAIILHAVPRHTAQIILPGDVDTFILHQIALNGAEIARHLPQRHIVAQGVGVAHLLRGDRRQVRRGAGRRRAAGLIPLLNVLLCLLVGDVAEVRVRHITRRPFQRGHNVPRFACRVQLAIHIHQHIRLQRRHNVVARADAGAALHPVSLILRQNVPHP